MIYKTLFISAVILTGCANTTTQMFPDDHFNWVRSSRPPLVPKTHIVDWATFHEKCAQFSCNGVMPAACIIYRVAHGDALIYTTRANLKLNGSRLLRHEKIHAAGFDHPGACPKSEN